MLKTNASAHTFVNGEHASESEPTQLFHNDRLIIGNNHVFRVVDAFASVATEEGAPEYDWRFAIEEMHKKKMAALNAQEQKRREQVGFILSASLSLSLSLSLFFACLRTSQHLEHSTGGT